MQYYNSELLKTNSNLLEYFKNGVEDENKNISHCLLFWGSDISSQCALALEVARLLNCTKDKALDCDCLNCKWIKEQTHPAVKIYTRLDFKESSSNSSDDDESATKGKKNITIEQAKAIISELAVSSDYHRVYIFCDRDDEGNLLPLNQLNFPEATSNALLKTFEEPPKNTTFVFLTHDKTDIVSTVVSRSQSFFVQGINKIDEDYSMVESVISNYWQISRNDVLEFENNILNVISENDSIEVLRQVQNYILANMKSNFQNKALYYKLLKDIRFVEDAIRQLSLTNPMTLQNVIENMCFKLILGE